MKKFVSLLLALAFAFSLCACSGSPDGTSSGAESGTSSEGNADGYELTMWLFQDWTVGTAAEIFNTWADEYIAQHPEVKSITFVGKPDTEIVSGFMAGVSQS